MLLNAAIPALLVGLLGLTPFSNALIYDSVHSLPDLNHYDYVIVGGGVAGSVVANRLSENSKMKILLLEAGPTNRGIFEIQVPFYFWLGTPDRVNWNYTTVPQPNANNRSIVYPRGHVLGGSSAINGMIYDRGTSDDYDKLAKITGDSGWAWNNMLRYFKKLETFGVPADHHNITGEFDPTVHGFNGPLGVSLPGFSQHIDELILDTIGNNSIYPFTEDLNRGDEKGFGWQVSTIHNGTRTTAATAYLNDAYVARKNLDVLVGALVTRVLSSDGKTIDTVEFNQETNIHIRASREIIMSAGSVNTPHILLNSGIGDSKTLSSLNIKPFHNLPAVGKNMSDTTVMYITWEVNSINGTFDFLLNNLTAREEAFAEWNATQTGRMANGVYNLSGLLRLNTSSPDALAIRQQFGDPTAGPNAAEFEIIFIDGGLNGPTNKSHFSMLLGALSTLSRGSISLNKTDPLGPPLFDPAYLASEYDRLVLRQAFKTAIQFTSRDPWKPYLAAPINGLGDAITAFNNGNFDILDEFIRNGVQDGAHVVGTSMMSPYNANWGVVDPDLRVKGIKGLRVVDASVYPFVPGGGTQLPTYCLAERASDVIKSSQ